MLTNQLWCVLRARTACQLTAHTTDLAEARKVAAAWQADGTGPAVIVPDADVTAARAAARARAARLAPADPDALAELVKQAEHQALIRLLYARLPFILCQPGGVPGTCYLLCFDQPYCHARHYVGWSEAGQLDRRLTEHTTGRGARLMAVITAAGITTTLTRQWDGADRYFERLLKVRWHGAGDLCPRCTPGNRRAIPQTTTDRQIAAVADTGGTR
jgi:hypothetical protein